MEGSLLPQIEKPTNILSSPATPVSHLLFASCLLCLNPQQMREDPLTINIFSMEPGSTAQPFHFRTHENVVRPSSYISIPDIDRLQQADDEYEILARVQKLVESHYVDGIPRHHLPSARKVELEPGASTFFIVDYKEFITMLARTIQDIARDRNIVVRNVPQDIYDWSLQTLSAVGHLDQPRDIQGISLVFPLHCAN
jgi:hypothetical protein